MGSDQLTYSLDELRRKVTGFLDSQNPNMALSITTHLSMEKRNEDAFLGMAAELGRATQKMAGVRDLDVRKQFGTGPGAPSGVRYLIFEDWATVRDFKRQWESPHMKKFQESVTPLLTAVPEVTFYTGGGGSRGLVQVLATGQQQCWDADGNVIDGAWSGQDGAVRAGKKAPEPRFTDNNNGTVTDNQTGLIWLKDANFFGEVPWEQALQIARSLKDGMAGLSDGSTEGQWRMPNINELQSLLNLNNTFGPAVAPSHPFRNLVSANYWSSTTVAVAPPLGWYTAFGVGPPVFDLKFNRMRMLPVRGGDQPVIQQTGQTQCFNSMGQPVPCLGTGQDGELQTGVKFPHPRFTDNNDGTVTDNLTGLVWLRDFGYFGRKSWEEALAACNSLASGQGELNDNSKPGQWRLPNLFELRSLMDYSQYGPALTPGHPFKNVQTSLYWSSTTVPSAPNLARFVFVGIGPSVWDHKSVLMNVAAVKDA